MSFGKNKILYLLIILSSFAIIFSYENSPKYNNKLINFLKFSDNKFIAHGGGGIKNYKYTNSIESVNKSINDGFKLIELDLHETVDNIFVGLHDWESFKINTNYNKNKNLRKLSFKEFKTLKLFKKYKPITIFEINEVFSSNESLFLLTDKTNDFKKIKSDFKFDNSRILVEIFGKKNLKIAVKENIKNPVLNYNTGDYNFIIRNNIKIITASFNDILSEKKFLKN